MPYADIIGWPHQRKAGTFVPKRSCYSPELGMPPSIFSRGGDQGGRGKGDALDRAPLLALLDQGLRQRVRKRLNRRRISPGKPIYRVGDLSDELFLIESGRVRVFVGERVGQERVLHFLGQGEILGESAFMAETPHMTSAVAVDNVSVWGLRRADFDALLGGHEGVLRYLGSVAAERQAQANARLAAETAPEESRAARGYVTAVYSPRGGAGVTTLAVNLATALAEHHPDDTVLLDLDVLFGHTLANLWLEPRGVLAQVSPATMRSLDRGGLDHYLLTHSSSLRIFPAATRPEEGQTITGEHIRAVVPTLRRNFGHVVLDLPHGFNEVTLAGLELADRVLLVATPEQVTLQDVLECRRIFADVLFVPPDHVSYVLNHPQPYSGLQLSEFTAATQTPWSEIPHGGEAPSTAALRGESLLGTRPNNVVARAAAELAQRIAAEAREQTALSGRPG
jgi:CRP-like cAMP-binding protein